MKRYCTVVYKSSKPMHFTGHNKWLVKFFAMWLIYLFIFYLNEVITFKKYLDHPRAVITPPRVLGVDTYEAFKQLF